MKNITDNTRNKVGDKILVDYQKISDSILPKIWIGFTNNVWEGVRVSVGAGVGGTTSTLKLAI